MKKIIKFFSPTCGPCKVMSKKLAELKDVEIQEIDIADEDNEKLLEEYQVRAVPTVVVLAEDNSQIAKFVGITPIEKIKDVLD